MEKIATKTYDFATLRNTHNIYVDKTRYLHRLVTTDAASAAFFISRPRRFGKSLMISTLECIFKGRKELFDGLYIKEETDYDWPVVPVLKFSLSQVNCGSVEEVNNSLRRMICEAVPADVLDAAAIADQKPRDVFRYAIQKMAKQIGSVVVLIDEYDYPINHTLDNPELCEAVRVQLSEFYQTLKDTEHLLRFLMITGISKFSKLSLFSGLNNITDLTMDDAYAAMFGYTEEELTTYFSEHMRARAKRMGLSDEAFHAELKRWYNGYRFIDDVPSVYNPFAIARVLTENSRRFGSTWTQDCRPTLLVNFLKQLRSLNVDLNKTIYAEPSALSEVTALQSLNPVGILFQTGYLTIDRFDTEMGRYVLRIPDEEIRIDLNTILRDLADNGRCTDFAALRQAFNDDDIDTFLALLRPMYATLVYGTKEDSIHEDNYRRVLHSLFIVEKIKCKAEAHQSNGKRADLVVEHKDRVYIFEFKNRAGADAQVALEQIEDRRYMAPYQYPGIKIRQIGLAFDPKTHELVDWAWRTVGADAGRSGKMPEAEKSGSEA